MDHFLQLLASGEFKFHDLGPKENMIRYGTKNAPEFYPENIICKNMAIFIGDRDSVMDPKDMNEVISRLKGKYN